MACRLHPRLDWSSSGGNPPEGETMVRACVPAIDADRFNLGGSVDQVPRQTGDPGGLDSPHYQPVWSIEPPDRYHAMPAKPRMVGQSETKASVPDNPPIANPTAFENAVSIATAASATITIARELQIGDASCRMAKAPVMTESGAMSDDIQPGSARNHERTISPSGVAPRLPCGRPSRSPMRRCAKATLDAIHQAARKMSVRPAMPSG